MNNKTLCIRYDSEDKELSEVLKFYKTNGINVSALIKKSLINEGIKMKKLYEMMDK